MRIYFLPIFLFFLLPIGMQGQQTVDWETLTDISYKEKSSKTVDGFTFQKPLFSKKVSEFEGKRVRVTGYMLPLTVDQHLYILSQFSFTECFFCNPASGKASVLELRIKGKTKRYRLDETLTWEGTLRLVEDPYGLCYVLEEAVEVK